MLRRKFRPQPKMLTIKVLFIVSILFSFSPALAQDLELKKDFHKWAKALSREKAISAQVVFSSPLLDVSSAPKLPFSIEGTLEWKFPDNFSIKMKNSLLQYQLIYDGMAATELVEFKGLSPFYTHYSNLVDAPISFALKMFAALEKSEVEFFAELEKDYKTQSTTLPDGDLVWTLNAKESKSYYQTLTIRKTSEATLPKSIEAVDKLGKKSFILFRGSQNAEHLFELPFFLPWPKDAIIRQIQ